MYTLITEFCWQMYNWLQGEPTQHALRIHHNYKETDADCQSPVSYTYVISFFQMFVHLSNDSLSQKHIHSSCGSPW